MNLGRKRQIDKWELRAQEQMSISSRQGSILPQWLRDGSFSNGVERLVNHLEGVSKTPTSSARPKYIPEY